MKVELSIIITSYRNPAVLKLCIQSIKKNIKDIVYEILVMDSATQEETEMLIREEFNDVHFHPHQANVGFLRLVNKGIRRAKGDYFLILNSDIIVERNSVNKLLDFLKRDKKIGIVGPKLLGFDGKLQYSCFRFYTPMIIIYRRTFLGKFGFAKKAIDKFLMRDFDHDKIIEADWIMGSAMMTSSEAVKKVGLMDERFFMYFEDVDWCRRFWEKGFKVVFYPYSEMYHYHGKGSASQGVIRSLIFNKYTRYHIVSGCKYFIKYFLKKNPRRK